MTIPYARKHCVTTMDYEWATGGFSNMDNCKDCYDSHI